MTKRKRRRWCLFERNNTEWEMTFTCDLVKLTTDEGYDESLPHVIEVFDDDPDIDFLMEGMELAWGLIANAQSVAGDGKVAGWQEAMERWRDNYWHKALEGNDDKA